VQAYQIDKYPGQPPVWAADILAVKSELKVVPADARHEVRVLLVDVDTSKRSVVDILNGLIPQGTVLRKWRIGGARGGKLIEMSVEED
jgi:hypothetical protein